MQAFYRGPGFALATLLMTANGLIAAEPQQKKPFVPNYMAVDEGQTVVAEWQAAGHFEEGHARCRQKSR